MRRIFSISFVLLVFMVFTSNRSGRLNESGQAATTAPGEAGRFCGSFGCHFSSNFDTEIKLKVLDENDKLVNAYVPGQKYKVALNFNHSGNPVGHGFQMVSLKDADESGVNTFEDLPNFTQSLMHLDRQYIEHATIMPVDSLVISWIAPETGSGDVTFYAAGNSIDGSNSSANDSSDTVRFHLKEDNVSSILNTDDNIISIYPNPASNVIFIKENKSRVESINIYNVNGQLKAQYNNTISIDISQLTQGLYVINLIDKEGNIKTNKFLKI